MNMSWPPSAGGARERRQQLVDDHVLPERRVALRLGNTDRTTEQGVRLAQNMLVGPCIPVGIQLEERLKLAQLLGQLGIFLTTGSSPIAGGAVLR
jgi:hypothetical protein